VESQIELRHLRYFVAVGEELHFGRAAERLHLSQSPLSRAIRELERALGVVLFVRTTRRVELTPAGLLLLERARRALVEIDALKDEPLLAALPRSHRFASEEAIPISEFVSELVLLPSDPAGLLFNTWLPSVIRAQGFELERTTASASAPWDRRLPPVASGETVAVMVADWADEPGSGLVGVPFDPPLNFPTDLASRWPPTEEVTGLVESVIRVRDSEAWLTERPARTELPQD
jgi:DNA-binding transcriptional LysR family regulator